MSALKQKITDAVKDAMRAQLKDRLGTLRMATAAFKQKEVDERIELTDAQVVDILVKMIKQRKEASAQFLAAGRQELVDKEQSEIMVLEEFLPQQLSEPDIQTEIKEVIAALGAASVKDMGKVMAELKHLFAGRADMAVVGQQVKQLLS
ncbi:MAG: GatB/YqeY domain-containing protein [Gammaproteobacteria bacterium]|nr:GatB/YqeY domain-containing protein [Gammaproteobacteria bacterium]MCD8524245.1 GatB/YqeY domain-containing protein [Gammaproteobacteria bacterium]MCD8543273.1 GatB/YqeY domain-containing protein [Gammaproteobacteria bacterium]